MGTSAHIGERSKMGWEHEYVKPAVARDEVPLIAGPEHCRARDRARTLAVRTEDSRVNLYQRRRKSIQVLHRRRNRDIEVSRKTLRSMGLDSDPTDGDVFDLVTRERLKQLAGVERVAAAHGFGVVRRFTAARPTRSSEATVFQFNASSSRSDIGRRRASTTASGTASGSRTAASSAESTGRV